MKKRLIALSILFVQILFLAGMIVYHAAKLQTADRVLLKTIPYDPRSIFRGSYVALTYEINSLPQDLLRDIQVKDVKSGDHLFVGLTKKGDYWAAQSIYKNRPRDGEIYLRGRVEEYWSYRYGEDKKINIKYGIESFFLNEERAQEVEKLNTWQAGTWQAMENEKDKRLQELDEEAYRIREAGISKWWVKLLNKELPVWVAQGIITQEQKDAVHNKYASAMQTIDSVAQEISSGNIAGRTPIIVDVAIDRSGNGYPVKLLVDGKEYK